jgi:elongation factor P--(R)-beta-lysine ligase
MNFRPTARIETLQQRSALLAATRAFFAEHGYWECETPLLSHDVVVDANLDPLTSQVGSEMLFLQTSPEASMKRLLASGATAIFQITRSFRQGERGPLHNPEFTMLEWYRVGDSHHDQMAFVERLVRYVYEQASTLTGRAPAAAGKSAFEKLTYDEAFERHAGQRVLQLETHALIEIARQHEIKTPQSLPADDRDGWLNLLLAELVEPYLGKTTPTFLYDYPASQCALARIRDDAVAERFELYDRGIELCNGYHELTDPDELARRTQTERELRRANAHPDLPGAPKLEAAMREGLPPCSGVALGFDRLTMLALGKTIIDEVISFPIERA